MTHAWHQIKDTPVGTLWGCDCGLTALMFDGSPAETFPNHDTKTTEE